MRIAAAAALLCLALPAAAEQRDAKGCQDHPALTRMPNSWIHSCQEKTFDAVPFAMGRGKADATVEGRFWRLNYRPAAGAPKASEVQVQRNFENAVKAKGGAVLHSEKGRSTLKLAKDGKELWVDLRADFTGGYQLVLVERGAMAQDVVADADAFAGDLAATGHVAVYGLLFDTGKAELKPESAAALGEVAKLLQGDPALKLHVVGHTDAVGAPEDNLRLSQARAETVLRALTQQHGIAPARLRAFGAGPFAPVASNEVEEGRAKNRRVELVRQ